jgi:hypothetical protein
VQHALLEAKTGDRAFFIQININALNRLDDSSVRERQTAFLHNDDAGCVAGLLKANGRSHANLGAVDRQAHP